MSHKGFGDYLMRVIIRVFLYDVLHQVNVI